MGDWLFGGRGRVNEKPKPAAGLRIQSSLEGLPIPIVLGGQVRISCNLIDYTDFRAIAQSSGGGKGVGAAGGKGQVTGYKYSAAIVAGISDGPLASIDAVWNNKSKQTLASLNLTAFLGTSVQTAWGYMTSAHPERALAYRGLAYVAAGPMQLGDTPELPNLSFEVTSTRANAIAGAPDADPADVVEAALADANFGAGFPAGLIGDLSDYSDYCRAAGLVVSPALTSPTEAAAFLSDLLAATNSEFVWSAGALIVVPRGDDEITGNSVIWSPAIAPVYDLDEDAYIADAGAAPVRFTRRPAAERFNAIPVEYLDRAAEPASAESNPYDPAVVEAKDDAAIAAFGLRPADKKSWPFFCLGSAARMAAELALGREQGQSPFTFTVGPEYILLEPMDVVTLSEAGLGLDRTPVRILEITENEDHALAIVAEELLIGSAAAPLYGAQANDGAVPDYNQDPGDANAPIIFEPTEALAGGLEIDLAVSGQDTGLWGGCEVYVSYDEETYQRIGRIEGPARMGLLTEALPSVAANPVGQTIDETNTLRVDLSESAGTLTSGSQADALALNTLCFIEGGEFVAFQTATLTGANRYDLDYLVRGAYGTESEIATHPAGRRFCRVDDSLLRLPFTQDRIGATVYFKFLSFNIWGGGIQSLADVAAVAYTITGSALASPMPDIANLRTAYVDSTSKLEWDEVDDFRPARYEIRKGDTWDTALTIGDVAHPPFVTYGDGTYQIKAYSTPIAGLKVYSEDATALAIAGSIVEHNVVASHDEKADGWIGFLSAELAVDGTSLRTATAGPTTGTYEIPEAHWYDAGHVRPTRLGATWKATGVPADQNVLDIADFLSQPDILGSAAARFVNSYVEVAISNEADDDIFGPSDVFDPVDVFASNLNWGPWVKFTPGVYVGRYFKFRAVVEAINASAVGYLLEFSTSADVEDRNDHLTDVTIPDTGLAIAYRPDNAAEDAPFKGGPNGSSTPHIQVTIRDTAAGDRIVVTSATLAGATVTILNAGVGVARQADILIQGW